MKQPKQIKPEHAKCASCGKPIHISELACISGGNGLKLYHGNICCLIDMLKDQKGEKK